MTALALVALLAPPGADIVSSSAMFDGAGYQPGKPITVALKLDIEPEWHVYWKNPGDSGVGTDAAWTMPAGWRRLPLRFPTPVRYELGAGYGASFGYSDQVAFLVDLIPPFGFKGDAKFKVDMTVLACHNDCLPADQTIEFTIPPLSGAQPPSALGAYRDKLPAVKMLSDAKVAFDQGIYTFTLPVASQLKDAVTLEFFPAVAGQVHSEKPIKSEKLADGRWQITAHAGINIKSAPKQVPFLVVPLDASKKRLNPGVEFLP